MCSFLWRICARYVEPNTLNSDVCKVGQGIVSERRVSGLREVAQQVRALAATPDSLHSVSFPTWWQERSPGLEVVLLATSTHSNITCISVVQKQASGPL